MAFLSEPLASQLGYGFTDLGGGGGKLREQSGPGGRGGVGGRAAAHLQRLHMLIDPSGFLLQAGDGVLGANQSTIDPALGKKEAGGGA